MQMRRSEAKKRGLRIIDETRPATKVRRPARSGDVKTKSA
jgi:hypothetical protein